VSHSYDTLIVQYCLCSQKCSLRHRGLLTKPTRGSTGTSRWLNRTSGETLYNQHHHNSQSCTLGLLFASFLLLPESLRAATQAAPGRVVSLPVGNSGTWCQCLSPPVLSKAILNRPFCSKKEKAHEGTYFKISSWLSMSNNGPWK
jgi:hypothetical protein